MSVLREHMELITFLKECRDETTDNDLKELFEENIKSAINNFMDFLSSRKINSSQNLIKNEPNECSIFEPEALILPKKRESFFSKNEIKSDNAKNCDSEASKNEKDNAENFEQNEHKMNLKNETQFFF